MSSRAFLRPRHALVVEILESLDARFLADAACYFGGGTRIVLELGEYRESADIDMICSSSEGYRALRSTVTNRSLGKIASRKLKLAREVIADRYGIRTFVDIHGDRIKLEIVREGRVDITGTLAAGIPVPSLDRKSCFAEKFLANADRWGDESVLNRDTVDLAYMIQGWGNADASIGYAQAVAAYGTAVRAALRLSTSKLLEQKEYLKRCVKGLGLSDAKSLVAGLRKLNGWKPAAR